MNQQPDQPDSPAAELRAAAQLIRETAAAAAEQSPPPWTAFIVPPRHTMAYVFDAVRNRIVHGGGAGGRGHAPWFSPRAAEWIALMHPGVGEPLSDLLESAADDHENCFPSGTASIALMLARALLGTAQ
jgi:hypothetical protein